MIADHRLRLRPVDAHSVHAQDQVAVPLLCNRTDASQRFAQFRRPAGGDCTGGESMRLIIAPHDLGIGGSQINAIDMAAGVADAGHDVTVFGVPGPLVEYIERKGLPFVAAHPLPYRPAATRIAQMLRLSRRHRIDLIHAYEWPPCLDAYFGAHLVDRVPILCTVLGMFVPLVRPVSAAARDGDEFARR